MQAADLPLPNALNDSGVALLNTIGLQDYI
jgi:hypothetical protein